MTVPWICRPCDMLCIDKEHYQRHLAGDHSYTTEAESARLKTKYKAEHGG